MNRDYGVKLHGLLEFYQSIDSISIALYIIIVLSARSTSISMLLLMNLLIQPLGREKNIGKFRLWSTARDARNDARRESSSCHRTERVYRHISSPSQQHMWNGLARWISVDHCHTWPTNYAASRGVLLLWSSLPGKIPPDDTINDFGKLLNKSARTHLCKLEFIFTNHALSSG